MNAPDTPEQAKAQRMREALLAIRHEAGCGSSTASGAIKRIRRLADTATATEPAIRALTGEAK